MTNDKAGEAREGLFDNVAGKAKEIVGAVTGNDELVEEGQLQQVEASNRKSAVADAAIADAAREDAAQQVRDANVEAAEQTNAAHLEAERDRSAAELQQEREHTAAAQSAAAREAHESRLAEDRADRVAEAGLQDAADVAREAELAEQQAAAESSRLQQEADAAQQAAASLRAQIDR